ncbi:MAG TPA: type II toxin-antitoxin system RelE/ParE family toxin [Draconibacterium sp.]|nr:type II toxin-antitoxin system RelE/ParE family toxin [Draconibacterium sp.]
MVKRIIWTSRADQIYTYILEFYIQRNRSKTYSKKLNSEVKKLVQLLSKHPFLGKKSALPNIRISIKGNFNIIYKIYPEEIGILLFWNSRQNPNKLKDFLTDIK